MLGSMERKGRVIGCVGESWIRPGWKCRPEELVEGIPGLGGVALRSPRFARGFLPLLYVLPRGLHGAEGLTDFRDGCVCV